MRDVTTSLGEGAVVLVARIVAIPSRSTRNRVTATVPTATGGATTSETPMAPSVRCASALAASVEVIAETTSTQPAANGR